MSALTLAVLLVSQTAPAVAPGTQVRALTVSFLDAKGGDVTDLTPGDVALVENGIARDVVSFKPDRRPLSVALLVDTSAAMGSAYRLNVVDAVSGLVARLAEGTRYAVWTTGDRPSKLVDFTENRAAAGDALRRVAPQGGNTMLDAVSEASADLARLAHEGDRTAVVAITGSGPELSSRDKYRAVEEAEASAETFLSVQIDESRDDFESLANLSYVFDRLASDTGGRHEVILSAMGMDVASRKLSAALRSGYRLVYATEPNLRKRKLELSVARPHTTAIVPLGTASKP